MDGEINPEAIKTLEKGVIIGMHGTTYKTKPCKVLLMDSPSVPMSNSRLRIGRYRESSWISITIAEGKFRQIRKMTAAVGFPTLRLIRVRIGHIQLGQMEIGSLRSVDLDLFNA